MHGTVVSLNVKPDGGVPKHAVDSIDVTTEKVVQDKQRNLVHHGGCARAVTLYSMELIEKLRKEGHPIGPGTTGENITVRGLDWSAMSPGVRVVFEGGVELEITGDAPPCANINDSFEGTTSKRISEQANPGWARMCARVVTEGRIESGEGFEVLLGSGDS